MAFDDLGAMTASIWIEEDAALDRRSLERQPADVSADMRTAYSEFADLRVLDLSPEGCRVHVSHLCSGDRVYLKFDGLDPLLCEVRWSDAEEAGLQFAVALHPVIARHLAKSMTRR
ncbi:MAG TPA: PilZ domain-containing protein [Sphingomonas sp.]|jgi:uncharacterized protein (DUF2237 family)|nr:PilZ domain-containing protein [Sphingomonas sp.]